MTAFDRDAAIDAARSAVAKFPADVPLRAQWMAAARVFVDAALAPVVALHFARQGDLDPTFKYCPECQHEWPCPTAQAIADIKAKAGVR